MQRIPSQNLYLGQRIKCYLHRFRRHYWDSRNASSTFRNDNLHRNMANSSIHDWIIWLLRRYINAMIGKRKSLTLKESPAIERMNGAKSSSRCNPEVSTLPIRKKHFKNTSQSEELSMNYSFSRPMTIHIKQQSTDSLTIRNEILDKYRQFNM